MKRRDLLKRAGIAGGAGLLGAGAVGYYLTTGDDGSRDREGTETPGSDWQEMTSRPPTVTDAPEPGATESRATRTGEPVPYEDRFGRVVDVVEAGADPAGQQPLNGVLETEADDDTLLAFPPGTYRLRPATLAGHENLGLVNAGGGQVRFVAPAGVCLGSNPYLAMERIEGLLLAGLDFDFRADGAGGILQLVADGDLTVRDVRTRGHCRDQIAALRVDIVDEGGTGLVENLVAHNQGSDETLTGVYVSNDHAGELTFRNCQLHGFTDNGLYASAPGSEGGGDGVVHTVGGSFRNNNISNVRLGSVGSSARGVSIRVDAVPNVDSVNLRGIRLRRGHDQRIENCDIEIGADAGRSFGAIVFHADNAGAYVSDTRIRVDRNGVPAIHAFPRPEEREHAPLIENVTIEGAASGGFAATFDGRVGTVIRNCTIRQTGRDRGGVRFAEGNGCRIVDSRIEVTGDPVVLRNATAALRNTTLVTPDGERTIRDSVLQNEVVTV